MDVDSATRRDFGVLVNGARVVYGAVAGASAQEPRPETQLFQTEFGTLGAVFYSVWDSGYLCISAVGTSGFEGEGTHFFWSSEEASYKLSRKPCEKVYRLHQLYQLDVN